MNENVIRYLMDERKLSKTAAEKVFEKVNRHQDICAEFLTWLETRVYKLGDAIEIKGYTAEKISKLAPHLSGIGIYNVLVGLKEDPERMQKIIDQGFPRK